MPAFRIHKPLLLAVEEGLTDVIKHQRPTDKFLLGISRKKQFGSRDRKFIGKHIYDIIRYRRLFEYTFEQVPVTESSRYLSYAIMNLLRDDVEITNADDIMDDTELIPAWNKILKESTLENKTLLSYSDWMWDKGIEDYGGKWEEVAASMNDNPVTYLRANTIKTSVEKLQEELSRMEVETKPVDDTDALEMITRRKLSNDPLYRDGQFEFQDLASQHVSMMSHIEDNLVVLETCAGAGGKSLHLAALMNNTGRLIATDKIEARLEQLDYRRKRSGIKNLEIIKYKALADWIEQADRVILDVPCTASGTIWRKPEIKWKIGQPDLDQYTQIQKAILKEGADLLKPGGWLTYATCSIFKAEGESIIRDFLKENSNYELEQERRFLPLQDRTDGFYIAVLQKNK